MNALDFALPGHPGDIDFRDWLAARTPADAATLVVVAPGGTGPLRLPQVRPSGLAPGGRRGSRRRGSAPALHAACLVDLEGLTYRDLTSLFGFSSERSARQHAHDGRFVAAELGLWPWAVVGGRALHRAWWRDERFAAALRTWALELRPPDVEPTVRRLAPVVRLPAL